jgi:hypothetical protein
LYNNLLSIDNQITNYKTVDSTTSQRLFSNIITLNYDLVVEQVFKKLNRGLTLGIKRESNGDDDFIDLDDILLSNIHPKSPTVITHN